MEALFELAAVAKRAEPTPTTTDAVVADRRSARRETVCAAERRAAQRVARARRGGDKHQHADAGERIRAPRHAAASAVVNFEQKPEHVFNSHTP